MEYLIQRSEKEEHRTSVPCRKQQDGRFKPKYINYDIKCKWTKFST